MFTLQSRIYFVIIMLLSCMVHATEKVKLPITITNKNYSAVINKSGYLSSLKVKGNEYLASKSEDISAGFYLAAKGSSKLTRFMKTGTTSYERESEVAKISYTFDDDKISVHVSKINFKGSLYMIISNDVKTVNYLTGNSSVPTITVTPAKADCDNTRWFLGGTSLDISGSNRIWGPWRKHQVWDARLKPNGNNLSITIKPGNDKEVLPKPAETAPAPVVFTYTKTTTPAQIPLCMIGDSITWAGKGDHWRKDMLEIFPRLAFVGTHSAVLGYSHAGEGGNSTSAIINRMGEIPDCPYYSLLIGTNDSGVEAPAKRIEKIVKGLLKKKSVKKIFLCSILPCFTKNPKRDKDNSLTNVILREKMKTVFPNDKVVWVEFETPIRAIKDWGPKIKLHPTLEGYKIIAKIHAKKIAEELHIKDIATPPIPNTNTGVRVNNLWNSKKQTTSGPVIAGWYTISFRLDKIGEGQPRIKITSTNPNVKAPLDKTIKFSAPAIGKRATVKFFTGYEGYGYTRAKIKIEPINCEISKLLFEKSRPSQKASIYGNGIYIDMQNRPALGELIEKGTGK